MVPDKVVEFFDPHPGLMGCLEPLPDSVKVLVDWLAGQSMNLTDAIRQLTTAFAGGKFKVHDGLTGSHGERTGWIELTTGDWGKFPINAWRVIRFREI